MKALRSVGRIVFLAATCASLSVAQEPGRHPAYLHALSDLRDARAHLNQLAPSGKMDREEEHAMREIDAAIQEIRRAAIDDGKDISHHMPVDAHLQPAGRYHRALELLDKARNDVAREEDDRFAHGLRNRAVRHINEAQHIVARLIEQRARY
jgi:hypothetical protein